MKMTRFLALAIGAAMCAGLALAEEVKIAGTGAALGTMRLLGDAYEKRHPATKIIVLPSLGSGGGIKAVAKDAIDIGVSSRTLNGDERKLGLTQSEYARTPFVFVVSTKSSVTTLTSAQVADLYSGKAATWPDGSRVRVVLRPVGDGDSDQMKRMSPAIAQALSHAEKVPGTPFSITDQEAAHDLERIPGAFGSLAMAVIKSEDRSLRALELDGVAPTLKNTADGVYPHYKSLYVVTSPHVSAAGALFLAFVHSPDAAAVLTRNGHYRP